MTSHFCGNCGKKKHTHKNCPHPIISTGLICLFIPGLSLHDLYNHYLNNINLKLRPEIYKNLDSFLENNLHVVFINRRVSLNFIELLRGQYDVKNSTYVSFMLSLMTNSELVLLKNNDFDFLWRYLWCGPGPSRHKRDYISAKNKFNSIKHIIERAVVSSYTEPEWGLPKGRRKQHETNFDCANREFCEETGLSFLNYKILNIKPVEENYIATNSVNYCHYYYFAELTAPPQEFIINNDDQDQYKEVRMVNFFPLHKLKKMLRDYQTEKYKILNSVKNLIKFLILAVNVT